MLSPVFLTVPGLHGSDPLHWQSIAEREIPNCKRVSGIDFEQPVIATWADALRTEIRASKGNVVLIGHGFGCLASVMAIADNDTHVAGVILVAPALPQRFNVQGLVHSQPSTQQSLVPSLLACLPAQSLGVPGLVVASSNDPWMRLIHSHIWTPSVCQA